MRILGAAPLLALLATPALAAPPREHAVDPAAAARALNEPAVQDAVARTVAMIADIVLDTRVGPLAAYTDPADDVRPGDTLGEVVRRRDPHVTERLYDGTRRSLATAGRAADDAVVTAAELQRTADRLRAVLAPLADAAHRAGGDPAR